MGPEFGKRLAIGALRGYQGVLSPFLPRACRFSPSCSEYCIQAIEEHGLVRGTGLSVWRLLRCQPFCTGGYDPVQPRK